MIRRSRGQGAGAEMRIVGMEMRGSVAGAPEARGASSGSLPGLQVARGLAALAVTVHHALETSNGVPGSFSPDWLTTAGAAGVDVFFVISGFIMVHTSLRPGRPLNRPAPSAAGFLWRRAVRIYPLYWMACLAMLSLMGLGFFHGRVLSAVDIVTGLALVPGGHPIIGVAWTLVYEVYFYLVFAACLTSRSPKVTTLATGGGILLLLMLAQALPESAVQRFLSDPIPLEFLMGMTLAWVYPIIKARLGARSAAILALFGLALMHGAPMFVPHDNTHDLDGFARVATWGTAGLAIVAGLLLLPPTHNSIARWLVSLGNASYSLYLTHFFVLMGYALALRDDAVARLPQYWLVPPVVLVACLIGGVTHLMVERPLLQGGQRLTLRTRTPPKIRSGNDKALA
jgi:peptidoglycan/LPS O-acetylase OafA/YrhL